MSAILSARVPWGRPVAREIPVPPFADVDEHRRYLAELERFVALLDDRQPTLPTAALAGLVHAQAPQRQATPEEAAHLAPVALAVSLQVYFPAPWQPSQLAAELTAAGERWAPQPLADGGWGWDGDPDFLARRSAAGWNVERRERGDRARVEIAHDDLVLLWMDHFRPVIRVRDRRGEGSAQLFAAAVAVRERYAGDTGSPHPPSARGRG